MTVICHPHPKERPSNCASSRVACAGAALAKELKRPPGRIVRHHNIPGRDRRSIGNSSFPYGPFFSASLTNVDRLSHPMYAVPSLDELCCGA